MNLISLVHHYSLSISNNPWPIVKCLVNIDLMNKCPGEAEAVEMERKRHLVNGINRAKLEGIERCYTVQE